MSIITCAIILVIGYLLGIVFAAVMTVDRYDWYDEEIERLRRKLEERDNDGK